jgi:hypothetical protein
MTQNKEMGLKSIGWQGEGRACKNSGKPMAEWRVGIVVARKVNYFIAKNVRA